MSLPEEHRRETRQKIDSVDKEIIGEWLLLHGYYPEQYVLPPCFSMSGFVLKDNRYIKHDSLKSGNRKDLAKIAFPKTELTEREFAIIHPHYYHDLVWELIGSWEDVLAHLFNDHNKIYSYSFPIPVNEPTNGNKPLRSGRMIYEFLEMAEKDLVAEAHRYSYIIRLDITNFYPSIYTHTICWAWEGRGGENNGRIACANGSKSSRLGDRLDKLFQYANDGRTVGLPIGSVLTDLVAEVILSERDLVISQILDGVDKLKGEYLATRFKDDYRVLCKSESDARKIIKVIIESLKEFNLVVNEKKTQILRLPDGLYRPHAIEYEPHSFRHPKNLWDGKVHFKSFENVLLRTLRIHRDYPGTSIIEKFLSELILPKRTKAEDGQEVVKPVEKRLLVDFGYSINVSYHKKIKKTISLLFMLKNESPKSLGKVLAIIEHLLVHSGEDWIREYIRLQILSELSQSILKESCFEVLWLLYFNCRHNLDIDLKSVYKELRDKNLCNETLGTCNLLKNPFIVTLRGKKAGKGNICNPFEDENLRDIKLFVPTHELEDMYLVEYLDIFDRDNDD